ncbi:hypothetical protein D3C78_1192480 [compost metagenome]
MDEAFVEHAENHIDGQHRRQNEDAGIALALLEDCRRAAIAGEDILRQAYHALDLIDPACGIGKRHAVRQVEGNRRGDELARLVDGHRRLCAGEGGEV